MGIRGISHESMWHPDGYHSRCCHMGRLAGETRPGGPFLRARGTWVDHGAMATNRKKGANFADMDKEEHRRLSSKGGRACAAANARARDMNELALLLLDNPAPEGFARDIERLAPGFEGPLTNATAATAKMVHKAIRGDVRAFECVKGMADAALVARDGTGGPAFRFDFGTVIGRDFTDLHRRLVAGGLRDVWMPGGRGSLKSSTASLEVARIVAEDPEANAVVVQAVGANLRDGSFAQMEWALDALGLSSQWAMLPGIGRMRHKATGQLILFRGCDDPRKLKSIKFAHGTCSVLWFEEADQLRGMDEVRSVRQSVARGGDCLRLYTFNPPRSADSWANVECARVRASGDPAECVVDSCYTDAPPEWLGEGFILDAEGLRETDETAYRHEYLGEAVGVGGAVFPRAAFSPITDEQVAGFDRLHAGQDFGWWPDPWAFTLSAWEPGTRTLYTFAEAGGNRMQPAEQAEVIGGILAGVEGAERLPVLSDDADPGAIAAQRDCGVAARKAGKGGNRMRSYEWLSGVRWVIDPVRCPNLSREVRAMTYERARDGTWLNSVPDGNDHWVDATRYAMMPVCTRKGAYGTDRAPRERYVSPFGG